MAEEEQAVQLILGPNPSAANQIALGVTALDITMTVGVTRQVFDSQTRQIQGATIEWAASYLLSPTSAYQLLVSLTSALETYESSFGAIPKDPTFALTKSNTNIKPE